MGIVFTNHNIDLLSVEFDEITKNCNYTFSVDGETAIFTARMPLQPKVSKILGGVTWDCICGKEVGFPVRLIGK